jgi:Secretion system C-terminal sorting domain
MKKTFLIIFLLIYTVGYSQTVQAGLTNIGSVLIISAKPNANLTGNYSGGIITIRWSSSYIGTVLSNATTPFGSWDQSSIGTVGSYNYKNFNWAGSTFALNWTANNSYELFRTTVSGGTGTGTFELAPNGWLSNSDWYFEVGGNDFTDYSNAYYSSTVNAVPLPVELSSFKAQNTLNDVTLNWETKTEYNCEKFEIERKSLITEWSKIASVSASGNSNVAKQYFYTDKKLNSGKYSYRLKMVDLDGNFKYSDLINTEIAAPREFVLSQNYPNPFNPSTKINYNLSVDSKVILEVYNITGEMIGQLVNEEQSAGYYSIDFNSSSINRSLSSGVYFYRITAINKVTANNFSSIKKMILLK